MLKPGSRRSVITAAVFALVAWLLLHEAAAWVKFDWGALVAQLRNIRVLPALFGMTLIYLAYALRAWRWKILMKPSRNAAIGPLLRATLIGFAAMALLGRPAELIRPYLIARQSETSMSSQLVIWAIERMFDAAAFLTLIAAALLASRELRTLPHVAELGRAAFVLSCVVVLSGLFAAFAARDSQRFGAAVGRFLRPLSGALADRAARFSARLAEGASIMKDAATLAQVAGLSVLMWATITYAYVQVIHAFPAPLRGMGFSSVLLLVGFSLVGAMAQLPGGGTSQLLVVAALLNVFRMPAELAVSCGLVLWLTTYIAPVPAGLAFLRKEHLSLKSLERVSNINYLGSPRL